MTRTGKTARLTAHTQEPFAELHPRDAEALGIELLLAAEEDR